MPTPSAINKLTITRIQVRLLGDEDEGDQGEGEPMETKTEAAEEPSSSRGQSKKSKASSSSAVPPDAFQIILERIDGLRDVQNEHTDRMAAIQDQLNIFSTKFDSINTQQWTFGHSGQKGGEFLRSSSWGGVPFWEEAAKNSIYQVYCSVLFYVYGYDVGYGIKFLNNVFIMGWYNVLNSLVILLFSKLMDMFGCETLVY